MSTALVPLAPAENERPIVHLLSRPRSEFLAHLIATLQRAPQTRVRCRNAPERAIAAYSASADACQRSLAGQAFARSL
jgi:hypothetical protein